jgi:hypothetical protein
VIIDGASSVATRNFIDNVIGDAAWFVRTFAALLEQAIHRDRFRVVARAEWALPCAGTYCAGRPKFAAACDFDAICRKTPKLKNTNNYRHLGALGSGNHSVEVCLDEVGFVRLMLHSGSRSVGNAIGTHFIELAN